MTLDTATPATSPGAGPLAVDRRNLPFTLEEPIGHRARIGLVVLATDQTVEHEFRQLLAIDGVAFYESRIYNDPEINEETLRAMEAHIAAAARLINPGPKLGALAFGCTSGTLLIGEKTVFAELAKAHPEAAFTSPMTAGTAALEALGARRIALLTPYIDSINRKMRAHIEAKGIAVPVMGSFNHSNDAEVARIGRRSLEAAILELGRRAEVDAVFVSCTSLRVAEYVEEFEHALGKPVTASSHAMAWHALRLAGCGDALRGRGMLFEAGLAA